MFEIKPPTLLASNVLSTAFADATRWVNNLDRQGWFLVLCAAVVVGFCCLRGFGSRSSY